MSFARSVRTALDVSLPLNQRVNALKLCIRRYRPIGFDATLSFLESMAGDFAADPEALPRAVDLLCVSYRAWQAELRAYGVMRRRVKVLGQRVPHPREPNPNRPSHWYGAPREAALHAVWFWYSKGASADVDMHALVAALVHRGRFTAVQREMFDEVHASLKERYAAVDGLRDLQTFSELHELLLVARQVEIVIGRV